MAIVTKLQWDPRILEPVFREIYAREHANQKQNFIPLFYNEVNSNKDTEHYEGVGAEGTMEEWGYSNHQVHYDSVEELWPKSIKNRKFSDGREIDRDWIDDLKLSQIRQRIQSMARSVHRTQQLQAAEFLNNAFVTTGPNWRGRLDNYAGPDGRPLCATDHPFSPTNDKDVQSNKGNSPLSIDSWDATAVAMQEWVDDRGNPMPMIPDTLIVHPYNARAAFQIAGLPEKELPPYEPGSNEFNANMYMGNIKVIVCPFIRAENRKNWFAVDSSRLKDLNIWQWRRKPETGNITDFDTETLKFKVVGRWAYGFLDYTFIYGHEVLD